MKSSTIPKKWLKVLQGIPGYDPLRTAEGCWFDPKSAQKSLDFFPEILQHVEGDVAGQPFKLEPWQQSIVANLFGWFTTDSQGRTVRRYRETLIYVPRKNGKTPLAAGLCLYVFAALGEPGAQVYGAAAELQQAKLLYRHARGMVDREPELSDRIKVYPTYSSMVRNDDPASAYRVISAKANTKHGGNPSLILVDELHALPNRELIDVLRTSTASSNRPNPLMVYITTADYNRESICNEIYARAVAVRDNPGDEGKPGYDPGFLPAIWEAGPDDDWTSEATWRKANPNLGVSVSLDYLRRECKNAQENPALENSFRRLHLNQKTEQDVRAISAVVWAKCGHNAEPIAWRAEMLERLRGRPCTGGLDLGATSDLTAFSLFFHAESPPYPALLWFWCPETTVAKRRLNRVPYDVWVRQGFMRSTEGDVADYDTIHEDILQIVSQFDLTPRDESGTFGGIGVDRLFQGAQLCNQLQGDGIPIVEFGQGFASMAAPVKMFFEMLHGGQLAHGNNPVLAWMAGNASTEEDPAGSLKFTKRRSGDKIDGIVALVMSIGRTLRRGGTYSYYDDHDMETL